MIRSHYQRLSWSSFADGDFRLDGLPKKNLRIVEGVHLWWLLFDGVGLRATVDHLRCYLLTETEIVNCHLSRAIDLYLW